MEPNPFYGGDLFNLKLVSVFGDENAIDESYKYFNGNVNCILNELYFNDESAPAETLDRVFLAN